MTTPCKAIDHFLTGRMSVIWRNLSFKKEITMTQTGTMKRLLSVKEAVTYLGISPQTIYNQNHRKTTNRFPVRSKRIGRRLLFDLRDLEAYVDSLGPP